jgi:hypothetical protein
MSPLNELAEQVLCLKFINPMRYRQFTRGRGLHRFDLLVNPGDRNQQLSSDATEHCHSHSFSG